MTDLDHVAVLRNWKCGHVMAIVAPDQAKVLYRCLVAMDRAGWQVAIEPNVNELFESLLEGPCPTCQFP